MNLVSFKVALLNLLIIHQKTEAQIYEYCAENQLSRCRTNHNAGLRVTSLKCAIPGCPKVNRLLSIFNPLEDQHPYQLQELEGQAHNHQAEVAPQRGMTSAQKEVVRLCIERGQSAPKQVNKTSIQTRRLLLFDSKKRFYIAKIFALLLVSL